jgi:iron only hydrogenase large subunit-like protein
MPCYDKKLEASRQDFYNEQYRTRDVDCVITTGELEVLMRENGWDLHVPVEDEDKMEAYVPKVDDSSSVSSVPTSLSSGTHVSDLELEIPELVQPPGSSSGSWLQTIIAHVQEREAARGRQTAVRSKIIRTGDYEEFWVESFSTLATTHSTAEAATTAEDTHPEVMFRGAKCYGFRNLQNVVRKVGREAGVRVGVGAAGRLLGNGTGNSASRATLRARRAKQQVGSAAEEGGEGDTGSGRIVKGADRPYDYVEIMACPAGCVNGGGQARRMYT